MKNTIRILISLSIFLFLSCHQNIDSNRHPISERRAVIESDSGLSVIDADNAEVPLAQILIGQKLGEPFANNFLATDEHGQLKIPTEWTSEQSISIVASGFVPVSFLHTAPGSHIFKLRKKILKNTLEYSGATAGYPPFDDRSIAHVSLVFEALQRANVWDFSLAQLLSPDADHLSVLGNDVSLPSNLAVPNQTVSYIISINISKPIFRIPLQAGTDHLMMGLQARFPVTDLVRGIRAKKSIFDMINIFEFASFTAEDLRIDKVAVYRDMNISQNPIALKAKLKAPKFDPSLVMIAMSALEKNQSLIALDIKTSASEGRIDLNTLTSTHQSEKYLTILKVKATAESAIGADQEFMSLALHDASLRVLPPQFEILAAPTASMSQIAQKLPAGAHSNIVESGMYFALSDVSSDANSGVNIENKNPIWEVFNPIWETQSLLPEVPKSFVDSLADTLVNTHVAANITQRWSIAVLGSDQKPSSDLGPDRLKEAQFISRTAVDLK